MPDKCSKSWMAKKILATVIALVLLAVGFCILREQEKGEALPGVLNEDFYERKVISVGEHQYIEKKNLTPILLIGYDKSENSSDFGYRNGGQSDFMLLTVIDDDNETVHRLQLERDTMTEVQVLSILGKDVGTNTLQLCLSHGYGSNPEECNERTLKAVSHLLQGVDLKYYVSMNLDGIPVLNDAVGGVDVYIEDDFSDVDPVLEKGKIVHLTGNHAVAYVRSRMAIGMGTNEERMRRHRVYLEAVSDQLKRKLDENSAFANDLLNRVSSVLETNLSRGRIINEMNRAKGYKMLPIETLSGEYKTGLDGYMEFHPDTDAILEFVLSTFFTPYE